MAEPEDTDSIPTQPWAGPPPEAGPVAPAPQPARSPNPRTPGWQPPAPEELQPSFPQYEIRGLIGSGGMGAIYRGWQRGLERLVAIKILPPQVAQRDPGFADRFRREAKAMARFSHPGIVAVYDTGETADGLLYFVMEYVEGSDLQKLLTAQGALPEQQALAITTQICDALSYAHQHGVIHRDIKPSNIMIAAGNRVKIADFGLAKVTGEELTTDLTKSHISMGTPDFMAPEASRNMTHVGPRADLYAVGVMLYLMLTGEIPRGRFDLPSVRKPGVHPGFDPIVDRAMQKDPERRYADASEIREELDQIARNEIPAPTANDLPSRLPSDLSGQPDATPGQPRPHRAHVSVRLWGCALTLALAVCIAVIAFPQLFQFFDNVSRAGAKQAPSESATGGPEASNPAAPTETPSPAPIARQMETPPPPRAEPSEPSVTPPPSVAITTPIPIPGQPTPSRLTTSQPADLPAITPLPANATPLPKTMPEGLLHPFLVNPNTASTGSKWPTYAPGQAPAARTLSLDEAAALADQKKTDELLYLVGAFRVTASGASRTVLRDANRPDDQSPRVVVEYPPGAVPPKENEHLVRDAAHPYAITDARRGADGVVTIYVREIITP